MIPQMKKSDLCRYFAETGFRPQNFVKEDSRVDRYKEHNTHKQLIEKIDGLLNVRNQPPMYLKERVKECAIEELGQFDVIVIDPPWEEYKKRAEYFNINGDSERLENWRLEELMQLKIPQVMTGRSFVFLWCGSEHLNDGRLLFNQWKLKRVDDIVWIKSNLENSVMKNFSYADENSILKRCKEHCLVGLQESSDKSIDPNYLHPNIDSDVILSEQPDNEDPRHFFMKPKEIYDIIERFCKGRRRLNLFGNVHDARPGWLVVGIDFKKEGNYDQELYQSYFEGDINPSDYYGGNLLGTTDEIEKLRPKSPPKNNQFLYVIYYVIQLNEFQKSTLKLIFIFVMDFYFTNNLLRPDFEAFLLQFNFTENKWEALFRGFPHISVDWNNFDLLLQFYEKKSEQNFLRFPLVKNFQVYQQKNSIIFEHDKLTFSIVFKKSDVIDKFLKNYEKYIFSYKHYLKRFQISNNTQIQSKLKFFEFFILKFDNKFDTSNYTIFIPFIYVLIKEPFVFQCVFENMFFQNYTLYRQTKSISSYVGLKKMVSIIAHLFIFTSKWILKKLLKKNFFEIIVEMIRAKFLLMGKTLSSDHFHQYYKEKITIFKSLGYLQEDKNQEYLNQEKEKMDESIKHLYVVEYLLDGIIEKKYIQIFQKKFQQQQIQCCKQIIINKISIQNLLKNFVEQKQDILVDVLLEIFLTIKHQRKYYLEMIKQMDFKYFKIILENIFNKIQIVKNDNGDEDIQIEQQNFPKKDQFYKILNLIFVFGTQNKILQEDFWFDNNYQNLQKLIHLYLNIEYPNDFTTYLLLKQVISNLRLYFDENEQKFHYQNIGKFFVKIACQKSYHLQKKIVCFFKAILYQKNYVFFQYFDIEFALLQIQKGFESQKKQQVLNVMVFLKYFIKIPNIYKSNKKEFKKIIKFIISSIRNNNKRQNMIFSTCLHFLKTFYDQILMKNDNDDQIKKEILSVLQELKQLYQQKKIFFQFQI